MCVSHISVSSIALTVWGTLVHSSPAPGGTHTQRDQLNTHSYSTHMHTCAQLHTHTHTLCFDVNSSRRGVQSTTPPVSPPPFFPLVFHCLPPCDTFSGMSRNPVLKHTHIHTHSHIHIMPCSQSKLCTFVRGEQLKHAHLHTHIHAHSCLNFSLSLCAHTQTHVQAFTT